MTFRITSAPGRGDETFLYAVTGESRDDCVRGVAAAQEQVSHAGGAAIFSEPRQMMASDKWLSSGTAVIFGMSAPISSLQQIEAA